MAHLQAVLFDKDGTLIDFHRTWDGAMGRGLRAAAPDDNALAAAATALDFDLASDTIGSGSPFIAEPNEVVLAMLEPLLDTATFVREATIAAAETITPAAGLPKLLHELRAHSVALAVVTNDWEDLARDQVQALGWGDLFDHIVGADSGFGAKPDPGMITATLDLLGVRAEAALMVGDSGHDIMAGRAAGVRTMLVTNGTEPDPAVADAADIVTRSLEFGVGLLPLGT